MRLRLEVPLDKNPKLRQRFTSDPLLLGHPLLPHRLHRAGDRWRGVPWIARFFRSGNRTTPGTARTGDLVQFLPRGLPVGPESGSPFGVDPPHFSFSGIDTEPGDQVQSAGIGGSLTITESLTQSEGGPPVSPGVRIPHEQPHIDGID